MLENNENVCVFKEVTECTPSDEYAPVSLTAARRSTSKTASLKRKDNLDSIFGSDTELHYHAKCYLKYTSKDHINRYLLKRKSDSKNDDAASSKRRTRTSVISFDFKKNCLICGEDCNVQIDTKHPDRWKKKKAFLCRTADRGGKDTLSFKDVLLNICKKRGDQLGDDVRIRLEGATSDLHAAEARYHERCLQIFENPKSTLLAQKDNPTKSPEEFAIRYVV